ncbi:hypothetical protein CPB86DRAFT_632511 [Serendipita vermifera]|nr:hypothetical protein CPB86DRAFT_632511 [Serendipita vermifera]
MNDPTFDDVPKKLRDRLKFGPPTQQKSDKLEALTGIVSVKPGFPVDLPTVLNNVATFALPKISISNYLNHAPSQKQDFASRGLPTPTPPTRSLKQKGRPQTPNPIFDDKAEERLKAEFKERPTTPGVATSAPAPNVPIPLLTPWHVYNEKASKEDSAMQKNINESMDVVLIFAGLFSATSTAFLQFTLPLLRKDASDDTNQLLLSIFNRLGNSSYPLPPRPTYDVSTTAISINCLIFASVAGSLIAAFFALSIKQWTRSYSSGLENIVTPQLLARHRQFRIEGVRQWHLVDISRTLPMILHISLALFAIGVAEYLLYTSGIGLATVIIVAGGVTTLIHVLLSLTPLLYPQAPFQSPLTTVLFGIWSKAQSHFRKFFHQPTYKDDGADPLDRMLGKETSISRLIHVSKHLDIGVLINLMEIADRHTEDWLLHLCLLEITQLYHIPNENYHLFYHETILETYFYLTTTCLYETGEGRSITPGMEPRAKAMCRFITWLASIYSEEIHHSLLWKSCKVGSSADTRGLAIALYEYGTAHGSLCDIIDGYLAWVASMHLCDLPKTERCRFCIDSHDERANTVVKFLLNYETENRDLTKSFEEGASVIEYITFQTRCAFRFKNPQYPSSDATRQLRLLIDKYNLNNPVFLEVWDLCSFDIPSASHGSFPDPWIDALQSIFRRTEHQRGKVPLSSVLHKPFPPAPAVVDEFPSWLPRRAHPPIRNLETSSPERIVIQMPASRPGLLHKAHPARSAAVDAVGGGSSFSFPPSPDPVSIVAPISGRKSPVRRSRSYGPRYPSRIEPRPPVPIVVQGGRSPSPIRFFSEERRPRSPKRLMSRRSRSRSPVVEMHVDLFEPPTPIEDPLLASRTQSRRPRLAEIRGRSLSRSPILERPTSRSPVVIHGSHSRPRSWERMLRRLPTPQITLVGEGRNRSSPSPPVAIFRQNRRNIARSPTRVTGRLPRRPRSSNDWSPKRGTEQVIRVNIPPSSGSWYQRRTRSRSRSPRYRSRARSYSPPRYRYRTRSRSLSPQHRSRNRSRRRSPSYRSRNRSRRRSRSRRRTRLSSTSPRQQRRDITPPPQNTINPPVYTSQEASNVQRGSPASVASADSLSAHYSRSTASSVSFLSISEVAMDHPVLAKVFCDVYIASTQIQTTAVQIHPDSSMTLAGSSKEGQKVGDLTEFTVDTGTADVIETQVDDSLAPCLFYAMRGNYDEPGFLSLTPGNALLQPRSTFWECLERDLHWLGVGPQIISSFIDCHSENLQPYEHIAYRFLSCEESAKMVRLSVGLPDCIFNSLCILVQGLSGSEANSAEWSECRPRFVDWASIVAFQGNFQDTHQNRVLELAMVYRSIPQMSAEQASGQNDNANPETEPQAQDLEIGEKELPDSDKYLPAVKE